MVRKIDDLADDRTQDINSPGEQFHNQFLADRPQPEWPPYIDESAKDLSADIHIGTTSLSPNNFGEEVGRLYRQGLEQSAGQYSDLPEVLENHVSDRLLGFLAYRLNELSHEISGTDLNGVQEATEAVLEKLLTRHVGAQADFSLDLDGSSVSHLATQVFEHETVAENVEILLGELQERSGQGLLALMDEPQMMTPLWRHQREALKSWQANDYRGYVDMATATGKTVLGLSAVALRYGELHPRDFEHFSSEGSMHSNGSEDILVVAHSDLILEQWRREFDRHLNIPKERTSGSNDISLSWGEVHFRTPQALVNEEHVDYDLVLLDEAHHYATGSEWGTLLESFDANVLALSGSVDDAGTDSQRIQDRLQNSIGPELKRYSIVEAKADGIIPSFDWEVHYAPYTDEEGDFATASKRAESAFDTFRQRLERDEITAPGNRRLRTYEDVRRFSHTSEGTELKQADDQFRNLVTRLFSRRTKRWNLSPSLATIVDLVAEHATSENVVVLADSNSQVAELEARLNGELSSSTPIYVVSKDLTINDQRELIDEFDNPESSGVLLGTGDLLGEGVDMKHASVAINMATGGVNPELVQRIGRVLRNPTDTPKHAMFYNVVGVPPSTEAAVPREDGRRLLMEAAEFCSLGARFEKMPGFAAESADDAVLGDLLTAGSNFIDSLDGLEGATSGDADRDRAHLAPLLAAVRDETEGVTTVLGAWEEYAWEHSKGDDNQPSDAQVPTSSNDKTSDQDQSMTIDDESEPDLSSLLEEIDEEVEAAIDDSSAVKEDNTRTEGDQNGSASIGEPLASDQESHGQPPADPNKTAVANSGTDRTANDSANSVSTPSGSDEPTASERDPKSLLTNARGKSVTNDRLLTVDSEYTPDYLGDDPAIAYFDESEQPHYFLYNRSKGVTVDDDRISTGWLGAYRGSLWVTSKGVHFFQGQSGSPDFHEFVSYEAIDGIQAKEGFLKNVLSFYTEESEYVFPTIRSSEDFDAAIEYINDRV